MSSDLFGFYVSLFNIDFAQEGWDIVLTARRQAPMDTLYKDLNKNYGTQVTIIVADLADPESPDKIYDGIQSKKIKIDGLVS